MKTRTLWLIWTIALWVAFGLAVLSIPLLLMGVWYDVRFAQSGAVLVLAAFVAGIVSGWVHDDWKGRAKEEQRSELIGLRKELQQFTMTKLWRRDHVNHTSELIHAISKDAGAMFDEFWQEWK